MKRNTRVRGVIQMIRKFCKDHGAAGRAIARFEFENWQRVLQTKRRYLWRPKRMKPQQVFKRMYREDNMGDANWSSVCSRQPLERPVPPDNASNR